MTTVIITGGTKGIGAEIARSFLESGWYVLIGARNKAGLAEESIERLRYSRLDAGSPQDHLRVTEEALEWTGHLDCYLNCAGFSKWKALKDLDERFLEQMLAINLKGVFWGCKAAAQKLEAGASIINVSSLAGKRGSANNSVYCATKFGVNGLTQALAKELGPRDIRVNAVCPVYVDTPGLAKALREEAAPPQGKDVDLYLTNFTADNTALQRLPEGREIGDLCIFLASTKASAITGQCINVDCGVMPQ